MPDDLGDEEMAEGVDSIARHTFTKEINLKQRQNYRTISLISHSSKTTVLVILNRLKAEAEELLAEDQAGFRPGRSTVEQIFTSRVIEKHLQHQRDVLNNFIEFKKAFDRVWHAGLRRILRSLIEEGLVQAIQALYIILQQCSPLEQSARGVLQDNRRCPPGKLTLTNSVRLVPGGNQAGSTP